MTRTLLTLLLAATAHAAPPAPGSDAPVSPELRQWIEHAETPSGIGLCCSLADGRKARIRQRDDGGYDVFFDSHTWPGGTDTWVPIPDNAILKEPSPFGQAFVWIYHSVVRCAALPGVS